MKRRWMKKRRRATAVRRLRGHEGPVARRTGVVGDQNGMGGDESRKEEKEKERKVYGEIPLH